MFRTGPYAVLRSLMPVYEENYRLMLQWLPGLRAIGAPLSLLPCARTSIRLTVLECSRFTSALFIYQAYGLRDQRFLRDLGIRCRIYHDAQLLEVLAYQGRARLAPVNPWPNRDMLAPFEKRHVNLFMGEWLRSQLSLGQRLDVPSPCCT